MEIAAERKLHLNAFQIKVIALFFMTLDHLGHYGIIVPTTTEHIIDDALRIVGRIAAPLFLFAVVESLRHTRSKVRFTFRLYAAGVVIAIFNRLIADATHSVEIGNTLPTFFYTALFVTAIEYIRTARGNRKTIFVSVCCLTIPFLAVPINIYLVANGYAGIWNIIKIFFPSPFTVDYSIIFVLLGIAWYYIDDIKINCVLFALLSALCLIVPPGIFFSVPLRCFSPLYCNIYVLFVERQWYMCLAIPFMLLYDGTKGRGMKYLFYIYYPAHVYVLHLIAFLPRA